MSQPKPSPFNVNEEVIAAAKILAGDEAVLDFGNGNGCAISDDHRLRERVRRCLLAAAIGAAGLQIDHRDFLDLCAASFALAQERTRGVKIKKIPDEAGKNA